MSSPQAINPSSPSSSLNYSTNVPQKCSCGKQLFWDADNYLDCMELLEKLSDNPEKYDHGL
jgi:hypothetical protein